MEFNFGNGLANMGTAIADTAGKYTLESQKAELEKEKVLLADQLAGAREEKHRGFLTSERLSTQEHTSGEKALDRVNALEAANIGLKGHLASAGAAIESANIHSRSIEKQIAAENDRAVVMQPNADMTVSMVNKVSGKATTLLGEDGKPIKVRDPDLAKAQYEAIRAVESDKKEIRLRYATDLSLAQSELNKLLASPMASVDETLKKSIEASRKYIDEVTRKRDAELEPHNARSRQLVDSLSRNIDTGPAAANFYKPPAAAPGIVNTPPSTDGPM